MEGASKFEQLRQIEISCNFTPENLLAVYPLLQQRSEFAKALMKDPDNILLQDGFGYLTKKIKEFLAL